MRIAFPFRGHCFGLVNCLCWVEPGVSYRRSSGLSNFFGFFGQQSQMNSPLIFGAGGFGTPKTGGIDIFPVASVAGGSRVLAPGRPLGGTGPAGELGFKMDFSW